MNGFLNKAGTEAFDRLYEDINNGTYKYPWFHGIENLTIDHVGYIYWKGGVVEHYELPWAYSEEAKKEALEVSRRCKILETKGEVPTNHSVIWTWPASEAQ